MTESILAFLKQIDSFAAVPDEQLTAFIEMSELCTYQPDEVIIKPGDEINRMMIILDGTVKAELKRGDQFMQLGEFSVGEITGKLPFSRMQSSMAYLTITEEATILITHEDKFHDITRHYQLTEVLVHALSDRVRSFTSRQHQNEKLMALGKLSAGLAHELNNPASAIVRSSTGLKENLRAKPEKFEEVLKLDLGPGQIHEINRLVFGKLRADHPELSLMERTEQEDELAAWMEDHDLDDAWGLAETFVDFCVTTENLEDLSGHLKPRQLPEVLKWIEDVFSSEKMIDEIDDAARRISDLVSSIKTYSHMDNANEKEQVNLRKVLNSTLKILNHKIKEKQLSVTLELPDELPEFCGYVSELNQVWMNLLDNAIDAAEKKGCITVRAEAARGNVYLYFSDNGTGIPEDVQSRIFDPFFTTKAVGQGTGMGLDLVRKIVDKHEGDISVKSEPGHTEFKLCFPLNSSPAV